MHYLCNGIGWLEVGLMCCLLDVIIESYLEIFVFRSVMPEILMFSDHLHVFLKVGELKALDITKILP